MLALFVIYFLVIVPAFLLVASLCPRLRVLLKFAPVILLFLVTSPAYATAPLTTVQSTTANAIMSWFVTQNLPNPSGVTPPITSNGSPAAKALFNGGVGTGANQLNQIFDKVYTVTAGSSTSIDLSAAMTNVAGSSTATLARVKVIMIRVLTSTTTSGQYDSVNGTAASSITIDGTVANAILSQSNSGWLSNSTSKFDLPNAGFLVSGVDSATGLVPSISGTNKILKLVNNDGSNNAAVQVTLFGADA